MATCQFPVTSDVRANLAHIRRQMRAGKERGADVAHFPEGALSGYAGTDFASFAGYDWGELRSAVSDVLEGSVVSAVGTQSFQPDDLFRCQ